MSWRISPFFAHAAQPSLSDARMKLVKSSALVTGAITYAVTGDFAQAVFYGMGVGMTGAAAEMILLGRDYTRAMKAFRQLEHRP